MFCCFVARRLPCSPKQGGEPASLWQIVFIVWESRKDRERTQECHSSVAMAWSKVSQAPSQNPKRAVPCWRAARQEARCCGRRFSFERKCSAIPRRNEKAAQLPTSRARSPRAGDSTRLSRHRSLAVVKTRRWVAGLTD